MNNNKGILIIGGILIVVALFYFNVIPIQFSVFEERGFINLADSSLTLTEHQGRASALCGLVCGTNYPTCSIPYDIGSKEGFIGWTQRAGIGWCTHVPIVIEETKYWGVSRTEGAVGNPLDGVQQSFMDSYATNQVTSTPTLKGNDGDLLISGSTTINLKENLKNKFFKLDFTYRNARCSLGSGGITYSYYLASRNGNSFSIGFVSVQELDSSLKFGGLSLEPHLLGNLVDVYFLGSYIDTVDTTDWDGVYLTGSATSPGSGCLDVHLINPRYKLEFSCDVEPNDMMAMETFGPNSDIDISNLRFPVSKFCLDVPAVLTDASIPATTSTAEIYQLLSEGGIYSTNSDQTVTVFYIFDNSESLIPTTCDYLTEFYSLEAEDCIPRFGIVQLCTDGLYDSSRHACVIDTDVVCEEGEDINYNEDTGVCEYLASTFGVCEDTEEWNSETGFCEYEPDTFTLCPLGLFDVETTTCIYHVTVDQLCKPGTLDVDEGTCELNIEGTCPLGYTKKEVSDEVYICTLPLEDSCKLLGGVWLGEVCDLYGGVDAPCNKDSDCVSSFICNDESKCVKPAELECTTDSDCSTGEICNTNNVCEDEDDEEPSFIEEYWIWLLVGGLGILLFLSLNKSYKGKNRWLRWLYLKRKFGIVGAILMVLLSYYSFNLGQVILELFSVEVIGGLMLFTSYLISSSIGYIIGAFIQDWMRYR